MKKLILSLLLLATATALHAQDSLAVQYARTITASDLKTHLSIIASDEYEGRETGSKGQKMAAEYLYKQLEEDKLLGPVKESSNPFFQPVALTARSWKDVFVQNGDTRLELFRDFFNYGTYLTPQKQIEAVFAGYGIDHENYSDYTDLDVTGKAVVILMGEPVDKEGNYLLSGTDEASEEFNNVNKMRLAKEKGAEMAFLVYEDEKAFNNRNELYKQYYSKPSISGKQNRTSNFGAYYTSPKGAAAVLGIPVKKLDKAMAKTRKKGASQAGKFTSSIQVKSEQEEAPVQTENVLAYLEGTDKKDELLVVTAHYDHIGKTGDEINNGADDDGSGTVTVLEVAEAFAQAAANGHRPRRSILFMLVTGEEKGLLGSDYYSENPIFPLENTIANLNIDMVGRVDPKHEEENNPDYIYVIGSDMLSTELHELHEEVAATYMPDLELDYRYNAKDDPNRFYYRSDHYNFAKHGIPVIFYFNGTHADYHRPTDTVEKIHFEKMEKIARLVFATAWELSNREGRPVVDKQPAE